MSHNPGLLSSTDEAKDDSLPACRRVSLPVPAALYYTTFNKLFDYGFDQLDAKLQLRSYIPGGYSTETNEVLAGVATGMLFRSGTHRFPLSTFHFPSVRAGPWASPFLTLWCLSIPAGKRPITMLLAGVGGGTVVGSTYLASYLYQIGLYGKYYG